MKRQVLNGINLVLLSLIIVSCSNTLKSQFEDCYQQKISAIELLQDSKVKKRIIQNYSQQYYDKLLTNTDIYSPIYVDSIQNCFYFYAWKNKRYNTTDNIHLRYYIDKDSIAATLRIENLEVDKSVDSDYSNWKQILESPQSINSLKSKAKQGKATAQYLLGVCYADGIGVEANIDKAIDLYTQSGNMGHSEALHTLSLIYSMKGENSRALFYQEKAARQGNIEAQSALGFYYEFKKDYNKALYWFKKAAEHSLDDILYVGKIYYAKEISTGYNMHNDKEAVKYFMLASKEDSEEANYWLGEIYSTSKQIPHDFAKALKYYQESANKGYIKAQMKLGEAYITGNTELVKKNRYKSLEWFRKAVEQGDPTAPYIVAIILEDKFLKSGGSFDELEELKKMEKEIEEDKIRFYGMIDSIIDKELIQRIRIALLTL